MAKTGTGALAVTPASVMTARPAAPTGRAEGSGGLRVLWAVNRKIAEEIESGRLRLPSEYEAARALIVSDVVRVLEVRAGGATAYVVAFLEDDEYHYAASAGEALRMAAGDPEGATLMTREEIERLVKRAAGRAG